MSWLLGPDATRDDAFSLRPELGRAHGAILAELASGPVPRRTLEACRLRMAQLLGATTALAETATDTETDDELLDRLPSWPHDPFFDDGERACLELAEQWVIDPHGIDETMLGAVTDAIGPDGVLYLTTALAVWDNQHRFDNALGLRPTTRS